MSRDIAKVIVKQAGFGEWLKILQLRFPDLGLYAMTGEWIHDRTKQCLVKGIRCDLSISWMDIGKMRQPYANLIAALLRKGELSEVARLLHPDDYVSMRRLVNIPFERFISGMFLEGSSGTGMSSRPLLMLRDLVNEWADTSVITEVVHVDPVRRMKITVTTNITFKSDGKAGERLDKDSSRFKDHR